MKVELSPTSVLLIPNTSGLYQHHKHDHYILVLDSYDHWGGNRYGVFIATDGFTRMVNLGNLKQDYWFVAQGHDLKLARK
jgi:hypothetical protein